MLATNTAADAYGMQGLGKDSISTQTCYEEQIVLQDIPRLTFRHVPTPESPADSGTLNGVVLTSQHGSWTGKIHDFDMGNCRHLRVRRKTRGLRGSGDHTRDVVKSSYTPKGAPLYFGIHRPKDRKSASTEKKRAKLEHGFSPLLLLSHRKRPSASISSSQRKTLALPDLTSPSYINIQGQAYKTPMVKRTISLVSPIHSSSPREERRLRTHSKSRSKVCSSAGQRRVYLLWSQSTLERMKSGTGKETINAVSMSS